MPLPVQKENFESSAPQDEPSGRLTSHGCKGLVTDVPLGCLIKE